jgi:hypothetical protein
VEPEQRADRRGVVVAALSGPAAGGLPPVPADRRHVEVPRADRRGPPVEHRLGLGREGDGSEPRRDRQALLRPGVHDVEAPRVDLERHPTEPGHRVDEQQGVGVADQRADLLERLVGARRGLGVDDGDEAGVRVRPERLGDAFGRDDPAPRFLDAHHLGTRALGGVGDPTPEDAVDPDDDGVPRLDDVDHRRLHARGPGARHRVGQRVRRPHHRPEHRGDLVGHLEEPRVEVPDQPPSLGRRVTRGCTGDGPGPSSSRSGGSAAVGGRVEGGGHARLLDGDQAAGPGRTTTLVTSRHPAPKRDRSTSGPYRSPLLRRRDEAGRSPSPEGGRMADWFPAAAFNATVSLAYLSIGMAHPPRGAPRRRVADEPAGPGHRPDLPVLLRGSRRPRRPPGRPREPREPRWQVYDLHLVVIDGVTAVSPCGTGRCAAVSQRSSVARSVFEDLEATSRGGARPARPRRPAARDRQAGARARRARAGHAGARRGLEASRRIVTAWSATTVRRTPPCGPAASAAAPREPRRDRWDRALAERCSWTTSPSCGR